MTPRDLTDDEIRAARERRAGWDEGEHPRHPKGSKGGGKFAKKPGGASAGDAKLNAKQRKALDGIIDRTGRDFRLEPVGDGSVVATEAADPYYEPSPLKYLIGPKGDVTELDRDGFPLEPEDA